MCVVRNAPAYFPYPYHDTDECGETNNKGTNRNPTAQAMKLNAAVSSHFQ